MKKLIVLIIFIFSISINLFGNNTYNNYLDEEPESWYLMMGLGFSIPSYSDNLENVEKEYKKITSINIDLLGVYFTLSENLLLGVILNGTSEDYEKNDIVTDIMGTEMRRLTSLNISAVSFGISGKYFLNQINKGFFARGDLGISGITVSTEDKTSLEGEREEKADGYSVLLGIGYAYPISSGTSILFSTNYTYRTAALKDDNDYVLTHSALNFTFGFLW